MRQINRWRAELKERKAIFAFFDRLNGRLCSLGRNPATSRRRLQQQRPLQRMDRQKFKSNQSAGFSLSKLAHARVCSPVRSRYLFALAQKGSVRRLRASVDADCIFAARSIVGWRFISHSCTNDPAQLLTLHLLEGALRLCCSSLDGARKLWPTSGDRAG